MYPGKPITKKLTKMSTGKPITNFFRVNQLGLMAVNVRLIDTWMADKSIHQHQIREKLAKLLSTSNFA